MIGFTAKARPKEDSCVMSVMRLGFRYATYTACSPGCIWGEGCGSLDFQKLEKLEKFIATRIITSVTRELELVTEWV
jgi:hypothetical protein